MKVKAFKETFKGNDLISLWEVDDEGIKKSEYPIVSFGKKKAKAIVECIKEIEEFVEE